jgi:hypothetical protein
VQSCFYKVDFFVKIEAVLASKIQCPLTYANGAKEKAVRQVYLTLH